MATEARGTRPHPATPQTSGIASLPGGEGVATRVAGAAAPASALAPAAGARGEGVPVDPITAEIVRSALVAITDEMKTNLMRTAYNMIIYEALDFTVGLFDADGNTVSIGLGLPMFIRGLSDAIKAKLAHYGKENIQPGDILLTNDSLHHGLAPEPHDLHPAHLLGGRAGRLQRLDGPLAGRRRHPARHDDGHLRGRPADADREDLPRRACSTTSWWRSSRRNVRFPDLAMGDFRAQIAVDQDRRAALRAAARSATGATRCWAASQQIYRHSGEVARQAVLAMPDGVYEAESYMDDDGVRLGQRIPIQVRSTVAGDEMTIDLTDVSRQVHGLLQLRRDGRALGGAGRLQVPDLAAAAADQRRLVRAAERSCCRRGGWCRR